MITLVEALNFRCLRHVRQPLGRFHVLVGPNATGKTTFLDVPAFLGRLVSDGLESALSERSGNVEDLIWRRSGTSFQLAVEARIPADRRPLLEDPQFDTIRYEVEIGIHPDTKEVSILAEKGTLKSASTESPAQKSLFPDLPHPPGSILTLKGRKGAKTVVNKVAGGNDSFDKHRYLVIRYQGGLEVPSWMASDGTLRLLALTLLPYLPEFTGVYLVEEPENGIHPRAIETMFQSLSSVYEAQILLATHSPVILSVVAAADVLCFAKTTEGATDIVAGNAHPALKDWKGETNLSVLFAAGVLG